jgi:6-phospho-beta-glucosidase
MGQKITVLGGGGVRAPLLVASLLRRAERIHLDEICLMDIDREKLGLIGPLCQALAAWLGSPVPIRTTHEAPRALDGARYIITTIRVGNEPGRVLDERIALRHHVLGQETTGPGGFAMAMRSIPAILDYAEQAETYAPGAWIFNFTNPAGLVAQALRDSGFTRTVGICDGANAAQNEASAYLGILPRDLRSEVFGLNHLSWARHLWRGDEDLLPKLLQDDVFLAATSQQYFDRELIRQGGMFLNEYLYYYHYADQAVARIQSEEETRGEEILRLNHDLLNQLKKIDPTRQPDAAFQAYIAYERRRHATYMHYARPDAPSQEEVWQGESTKLEDANLEESEGYAGVALDIVEAFETGVPAVTALNVPNQGAIPCMGPRDVVEVTCRVDGEGIHPLPVGEIPEPQELLMRQVKLYERRAVEAILERSREKAVMALMAHPLVLSYSLAAQLVDEYIAAHAAYIGKWS